ncbi:MAG: F0F1 ATP synthase subunit B' [Alphaproteobacteria bacterium]|nr:F0F1 ATP synthase subunit B' [Alphaproteobacteria bacterium]
MRTASALAAASVLLADAARAATGGDGAGGEATSGGLPQLDPSSYPSQIFWLIIAFALLYWLLAKRALPRVADILETRQDRIAADLDRAQSLRQEAEEAMARHEKLVADAQARARAELDAANERIRADAARQEAELERSLARQLAEADQRIAAAREDALKALEDVARDASREAVGRLVGVDITTEEAARVVADVRKQAA